MRKRKLFSMLHVYGDCLRIFCDRRRRVVAVGVERWVRQNQGHSPKDNELLSASEKLETFHSEMDVVWRRQKSLSLTARAGMLHHRISLKVHEERYSNKTFAFILALPRAHFRSVCHPNGIVDENPRLISETFLT